MFISFKSVKERKVLQDLRPTTGFQINQHMIQTVQSCILSWYLHLILLFNSMQIFYEVVLLDLTNC